MIFTIKLAIDSGIAKTKIRTQINHSLASTAERQREFRSQSVRESQKEILRA